jgi:hypothetical protein
LRQPFYAKYLTIFPYQLELIEEMIEYYTKELGSRAKPVVAFDNTGYFVGIYRNDISASKDLGVNAGNIHHVCTYKRVGTQGFVFRYAEDILADPICEVIVLDVDPTVALAGTIDYLQGRVTKLEETLQSLTEKDSTSMTQNRKEEFEKAFNASIARYGFNEYGRRMKPAEWREVSLIITDRLLNKLVAKEIGDFREQFKEQVEKNSRKSAFNILVELFPNDIYPEMIEALQILRKQI